MITTSEKCDQVMAALIAAQAEVNTAVAKSGTNTGQHYKYADLADFAAVADPILGKHGLGLIVSMSNAETLAMGEDKRGHSVRVTLIGRVVHTSGQWFETQMLGESKNFGDKAIYAATTGARKYMIACILNLVTSDDPELTRLEPPSPVAPQRRETPPVDPVADDPFRARKKQLRDAVQEWSGVQPEDLPAACRTLFASIGLPTDKLLNENEVEKAITAIEKHVADKTDFATLETK